VRSRFAGRVAVVTGASKGIGAAIARRLADEGGSVLMNARDAENLQRTAAGIAKTGGRVHCVPGNITRPGTCEQLIAAALEHFGRLDHVVNTVAVNLAYGPLLAAERDTFMGTMERNTWPSVDLVQQAVAQGMAEGGSVAVISTIGSHSLAPYLAAYSASKAALDLIVRHLARELGPRNIRVNAVAPGLVTTDMSQILWAGERKQAEEQLLPLGRLGRPSDIAATVTWLLSDDACWLTGQIIDVDGGRLLVGDEPADLIGADLTAPQPKPDAGPPSPGRAQHYTSAEGTR
jgi:NAD(P)-dependent dehydrogenase (short-subunit alcohol dehydrogenase family)